MLAFQQRLVEDEQDKSIDHRFTHYIVTKITGLTGDEEDTFMFRYRPSYQFTQWSSDYVFYDYIKHSYLQYQAELHHYHHRPPAKKEEFIQDNP